MKEKILVEKIAKDIRAIGGRMYFVGGCVRDEIIGLDSKDIDVEVFGIKPEQLKDILSKYGVIDEVGASFGVLMIHGVDVDFAMPRSERKTGNGHKGFDVEVNPFLSTEEACRRRDFTMNAIMKDVSTGEMIDHFGGIDDLENGIIRHIDDATFVEDELRALRACQFASRFHFVIAEETVELSKSFEFHLPKERVFEEVKKALLKGIEPSTAFLYMREMEILDKLLPELNSLIDCQQSPIHHPEGDVWNHTMLVIDELAKLRNLSNDPLALMLGGLLHDIGKPLSTQVSEDGKIASCGHEETGFHVAKAVMSRLTKEKKLTQKVLNIVRNHMRPNAIVFQSDKAMRKLMRDTDIHEIILMAEADHMGRGFLHENMNYDKEREWFRMKIKELSTNESSIGKIIPIVTGKDLIQAGMKPSSMFKKLLDEAEELQIEGLNKEDILGRIVG